MLKPGKILIICFLLFAITFSANAQKAIKDTSLHHSPTLASLLSTAIPGPGQVYNKKYWKVPIIYGLGGYLAYAAVKNNTEYNRFKKDYLYYIDGDSTTVDEFNGQISGDQLKYYKDAYRRQRDLNIIGVAAIYILNIVDASVDAHFFDYDISDDLSLNFMPKTDRNMALGLSVKLTFR